MHVHIPSNYSVYIDVLLYKDQLYDYTYIDSQLGHDKHVDAEDEAGVDGGGSSSSSSSSSSSGSGSTMEVELPIRAVLESPLLLRPPRLVDRPQQVFMVHKVRDFPTDSTNTKRTKEQGKGQTGQKERHTKTVVSQYDLSIYYQDIYSDDSFHEGMVAKQKAIGLGSVKYLTKMPWGGIYCTEYGAKHGHLIYNVLNTDNTSNNSSEHSANSAYSVGNDSIFHHFEALGCQLSSFYMKIIEEKTPLLSIQGETLAEKMCLAALRAPAQ